MRSLKILSDYARSVKGKKPEARYTALAVRPEETLDTTDGETLYLAAERQLPDGGVEIQVFVGNSAGAAGSSPLASFQAPPEPPFELSYGKHVVSFRYLAETNALVLVLAGGDIVVISLDEDLLPDQEKVEVVGSVESGVKAAEWSPDEELLVLVTGEDNLVEMTKSFDVLAEHPLKTEDFGEDAPVNVGWGAQTTQFHGSIGKSGRDAVAGLPAATRLNSADPSSSTSSVVSPADSDTTYRISWRGDGAFFAVSTLFELPQSQSRQRRLRFYSRTAVLQSTSEPTPALEGSLAWQPSGSIIASTANNASQVVFFERNGLRRYEFQLKEGAPEYQSVVRKLAWNADSSVLAVWIERLAAGPDQPKHVVQLWRRNNYHWYLKQSLRPLYSDDAPPEDVIWHGEQPLCLYVGHSTGCRRYSLAWDAYASIRSIPDDSGAVAVVDGSKLLFTPFRYQNVPPPMSSLVFEDPDGQTPVHAAFAPDSDVLATLMPDYSVNLWGWTFAKGNKSSVEHLACLQSPTQSQGESIRQIALSGSASTHGAHSFPSTLYMLGSRVGTPMSTLRIVQLRRSGNEITPHSTACQDLLFDIVGIQTFGNQAYLQTQTGGIISSASHTTQASSFGETCLSWSPLSESLFLGLSESGRLYANQRVLAMGCSSFAVAGDFLIYTTLQHEIRFILLDNITSTGGGEVPEDQVYSQPLRKEQEQDGSASSTYNRRVERGSRIVTVVPSSMTVVLQMPRGNLETISPRPLVLQVVRKYLDGKQYKEALLVCRRHRIDLNFLCDHDYAAFCADLALFVDQIGDVDHLNLFISNLKNLDITDTLYRSLSKHRYDGVTPSVTSDKVGKTCRALRAELEAKDLVRYANAILTTYVCQQPPDLESALRLISRIKGVDEPAAEDAVKYIIFLANANQLYDVALGMYDFELVLAVAQNSQKDPREYIPFLRELRGYETFYQRFKIDDHLRHYAKALRNLSMAGNEHFAAILDYISLHELYDEAVQAYADRPEVLRTILDLRGDWLMKDNRSPEAALSYTLAHQPRKAMIAHQKSLNWVELFEIAIAERLTAEEIKTLAQNMSAALEGKLRFAEAGRVTLEYGRDIPGAIASLSHGSEFSEALRIATMYNATHLIPQVIVPAALEAQARLMEEASEISEQTKKQVERLEVLREKRMHDSASFYGRLLPQEGDDALDNVDVQTEAASTVATTQFTRYTAAPASTRGGTVKTGRTKRSNKTDKKTLKKAMGGAKGSIFEESYLLGSLSRLVVENGRLHSLVSTTASLTRVLTRLSANSQAVVGLDSDSDLQDRARSLEQTVDELVQSLQKSVDDVWQALGEAKLHDLETAILADADPDAADLEILKRPEKPKFAVLGHWKVGLLGLLRT